MCFVYAMYQSLLASTVTDQLSQGVLSVWLQIVRLLSDNHTTRHDTSLCTDIAARLRCANQGSISQLY